jgi:predicted double-glycine peptidase
MDHWFAKTGKGRVSWRWNVKLYKQTPGLCGPASIRIALSHYGIQKSEKELAELSKATPQDGTSYNDLKVALRSFGINIEEYRNLDIKESMKKLRKSTKKNRPVVVCWMKIEDVSRLFISRKRRSLLMDCSHYSVVRKVGKTFVYILDPSESKELKVTHDYFLARWWDPIDARWFIVLGDRDETN